MEQCSFYMFANLISDNAINQLTHRHVMEIANTDVSEFAAKHQK